MRGLRAVAVLVAIGLGGYPALAQAPAQDLSGTLRKIKDSRSIALGHRDAAIPFSYRDPSGTVNGYAIDLCLRVAEALKSQLNTPDLKVDLVEVTAANRFRLVRNGTIDLECGATTNTLAREREVGFSVTHFVAGNRFVSKKRMGIQAFEDLKGLTVASISGTTNIRQVVDLNSDRGLEMEILPAPTPDDALRLVEQNRAAAFFWDDILLAGLVARADNPRQYAISSDALSVEPYALMLRKDDPRFKQAVDDVLVALFRSDEIGRLYDKWFRSPLPGLGITLDAPLNPATRRAFENPTDSADPLAYRS